MDDGPGLAELQRWMIGYLRNEASDLEVDQLVFPSATLTATGRMDLYRRGYELRLLECLQAMHPALRHLLGDEAFDAFALDYLAACAPSGYTLTRLNEGFAGHLATTRPHHESWPDLLIDIVRFERAFLEVYDGEGAEGEIVAGAACAPGDRSVVTVEAVPCLRLFRSRYPVGDYVCAVRRGQSPTLPTPRDTYLALVRRNYVVDLVDLAPDQFAALAMLTEGADSNEAARAAGVSARLVLEWIAGWADSGVFRRVVPRGVPCS